MPIEKERLISLLNAAAHIQDTLGTLITSTLNTVARAYAGSISDREALQSIEYLLQGHEYSIMADVVVITREQTHWRLTHRKAERNKLYQERRRREEGTPQRQRPGGAIPHESYPHQNYYREMEALGVSTEKARQLLEDQLSDEPPGALPAFEPSPEDQDGWSLPEAEPDDETT